MDLAILHVLIAAILALPTYLHDLLKNKWSDESTHALVVILAVESHPKGRRTVPFPSHLLRQPAMLYVAPQSPDIHTNDLNLYQRLTHWRYICNHARWEHT